MSNDPLPSTEPDIFSELRDEDYKINLDIKPSPHWDNSNPESPTLKKGFKLLVERKGITVVRDYDVPTEEIEAILKNPEILDLIISEIQKKVVGERTTLQTIFLNCCGIFVENNNTASYNLFINDESGAGKDFIVKNVLDIFPEEKVIHRTRISPTAFTYWHDSRREPEWTWDGKVCALMDTSEGVLNSDVFKVMVSDGSQTTIVRNQFAVDIEIRGKPVMIITSYSANPKTEMLRRFPILNLDTSKEQTRAIMKAQAEKASRGIKASYNQDVKEALYCLRRVKVKIPYAEQLYKEFPDSIIMRTHHSRMLDYIRASCALHQYQRETDSEGYYLATPQDYENARIILERTTTNSEMIPLTKKQKKLLDIMREGTEWRVKDLQSKVNFYVLSKLYEALDDLSKNDFIKIEVRDVEGIKKPVNFYSITSSSKNFDIPTWEDICNKKGIERNKEIEGNTRIKGIDEYNSLNSLNSSLPQPLEESLNEDSQNNLDILRSFLLDKGMIRDDLISRGVWYQTIDKALLEGVILESKPDFYVLNKG